MIFTTERFGEMACTDDQVITFPEGLAGRTTSTRYVVVDDEQTLPLQWLVSIDEPAVSLPVLDPAVVLDGVVAAAPVVNGTTTFVVAREGAGAIAWWLDLRHPVIINNASRTGQHVTLDDASLPANFPVTVQPAGEGE
jgi:flagellar assembly factor FliW